MGAILPKVSGSTRAAVTAVFLPRAWTRFVHPLAQKRLNPCEFSPKNVHMVWRS